MTDRTDRLLSVLVVLVALLVVTQTIFVPPGLLADIVIFAFGAIAIVYGLVQVLTI